jgi:hypothetical protein
MNLQCQSGEYLPRQSPPGCLKSRYENVSVTVTWIICPATTEMGEMLT